MGDNVSNVLKTLVCVAIAGALFITAVFYGVKWLFVVAAFFDWLPLPTGWMRIGGSVSTGSAGVRRATLLHGVVTGVAYAIGATWLFIDSVGILHLGYLFLLLWFQAVMLGVYATIEKLSLA